MFERTSSTESFARALAASLEQFLGSAQATRQQVDRALEVADAPSRADIAALGARIDALTSAVDALEEAFRASQAATRVAATRARSVKASRPAKKAAPALKTRSSPVANKKKTPKRRRA